MDPERPATYVAQSRTPDSYKAFITPEKPTMALKPPPEPTMAMTGTCSTTHKTVLLSQDDIEWLVIPGECEDAISEAVPPKCCSVMSVFRADFLFYYSTLCKHTNR